MGDPLLEIQGLSVRFHTPEGTAQAVDGVDLRVGPGEILGLVGESGCGKSVTALSVLRLIPSPPGEIHSGRVLFEGRDLLDLREEEIRRIRGRKISMIFQEPMTSLNPVMTVGRQIMEPLCLHLGLSKAEARQHAVQWLERVGIPAPGRRLRDYPHQLSGGMRQRIMIAMALACSPRLLMADEPTTALDVTIQAQILSLILRLQEEMGMAVVLITHDLGVVAQTVDRVVVMYAGEVVEEAGVTDLFDRPFHPYTQGLLASMPRLGAAVGGRRNRLAEIPGMVPPLTHRIPGCRFADRCPHVFSLCGERHPPLFSIREGHRARCWLKEHPNKRKEP